eukprot:COSAG02_NODE_3349_length_6890_cov_347.564865_2_plen_249_part_00
MSAPYASFRSPAPKLAVLGADITDFAGFLQKLPDGVDVSAPILSRSFQLLSEASLERDQIHKIRDTPFPFPFAQVCSLMLIIWCLTLPMLLTVFVETTWIAAVGSFLGVGTLFAVNCVASELECPFDDTPNDLCLEYLKDNFTDTMAETMAWLAHRSTGNVAGSIGEKPTEQPWTMMEKHMRLNRELIRGGGEKEVDFVDNPVSSTGQYNFIPEEVKMRVTGSACGKSDVYVSTMKTMTRKRRIFWIH